MKKSLLVSQSINIRLLALTCCTMLALCPLLTLAGRYAIRLLCPWQSVSDTEYTYQQTEALLKSAAVPDATNPLCGPRLADMLQRNGNSYTIHIIGVWGTYSSPIPGGTGSLTALVDVIFADGSRAELQFYADQLDNCRQLPNASDVF